MHFIIRYFPEITIKSRPVRKQMSRQLQGNLRTLLRPIDGDIRVEGGWDKLTVQTSLEDETSIGRIIEVLGNTPGIDNFLDVVEHPLVDLPDIARRTLELWGGRLAGRTFAVRCRRLGQHDFSSGDVERLVGAELMRGSGAAGVDLSHPQSMVRLEVKGDRVFIVNRRFDGLGGYPCGAIGSVLSLVSGGFDSTVASYQMMRRGLLTHFLFFNIGGHAHEVGVVETSLYLWMKYGASHKVKFISVPFESVVSEILQHVDNRYMGVVLKRMMLRAGSDIARQMDIEALVTGESVSQVSSQTLRNLAVIDSVTETLVMRPLIAADKAEIVNISRAIGTEEFAANMPEYCSVISVKPTTRARLERVEKEEQRFDFTVLEEAVGAARRMNIDEIAPLDEAAPAAELLSIPLAQSVVIDLRHPVEVERNPLRLVNNQVLEIPFYLLQRRFTQLDQGLRYMLYCDQGVMSKLHAAHLVQQGHANVCVYRPGRS